MMFLVQFTKSSPRHVIAMVPVWLTELFFMNYFQYVPLFMISKLFSKQYAEMESGKLQQSRNVYLTMIFDI